MFDASGNGQPDDRQPSPSTLLPRIVALLEVLICSEYPTQYAIVVTLAALGYRPGPSGQLTIGYVVALSLIDAVVLIGLILFFVRAHGERPRDLFIGRRPVAREASLGVALTFVALAIAIGVLLFVRRYTPWLHTVPHNPFEDLIQSPRQAAAFAVVVVIAGGVREELQRAFLLRRFDVWLGGPVVGLVATSLAFGAGHFEVQGADAALATGLLGAFWGIVYLWRRSFVAPVISHAGFDLLQIVEYSLVGR